MFINCNTAGLDTPDYDLFPSEEFQKNWIRDYLTEVARLKGVQYYRTSTLTDILYSEHLLITD